MKKKKQMLNNSAEAVKEVMSVLDSMTVTAK